MCNLRPTSRRPPLGLGHDRTTLSFSLPSGTVIQSHKSGGIFTSQNCRYISQYCLISLSATIVLYTTTSFYIGYYTLAAFSFSSCEGISYWHEIVDISLWLGISLGSPDAHFYTLFHLGNIFKDTSLDRSALSLSASFRCSWRIPINVVVPAISTFLIKMEVTVTLFWNTWCADWPVVLFIDI
jgi:hypothetical protein